MNSNALTDQNGGGKLNVLHFKDCYKHNFWTEIRGGKRIDAFEVFKAKYTYLDK
jgi:acyl-CoA-binding protein